MFIVSKSIYILLMMFLMVFGISCTKNLKSPLWNDYKETESVEGVSGSDKNDGDIDINDDEEDDNINDDEEESKDTQSTKVTSN